MNLTKLMAGLLGVAAGFSANASPPAAANGVMEFPNVSVVAQPASAPEPARAAPPQAGMMGFKDPVTGKLTGPTPQQAAALTAPPAGTATAGSTPRPTATRPSHGGLAVKLDGRHQRYALARKDAEGKVTETCEPHGQLGEHHEK